jgi:polyisoprenoid-binding protein YceI
MATAAQTALATCQIDPVHSQTAFAVKHLMISNIKGRLNFISGTVGFDDAGMPCSCEATLDAASIDTSEPNRDASLRSAQFLDVERYPTMSYRSNTVQPLGGNRYLILGTMTLCGVSREVPFEATFEGRATDHRGTDRTGFSGTAIIDRRDFGITWNQPLEAGGVFIGETVTISLDVEVISPKS